MTNNIKISYNTLYYFFFWYVRMLYIRTATLCIKNKEETQKIQEEENREKTKKENQPTN